MWNNWMENAKAMAADLDSKLNETVGIGDDGKPLDETTKTTETMAAPSPSTTVTSATKTASVAPSAGPPGGNDGGGGDDAWNDDFDFDDDDVELSGDAETSKATEAAAPKTTIPEKKKVEPTPATAAKTKSPSNFVPKESTLQPSQPPKQSAIAATASAASEKATIPTPTKPSPVVPEKKTKTPQPPSTPAVSLPVADSTANDKVGTPAEVPAADVAADPMTNEDGNKDGTGWGGDDDVDIDVGDDDEIAATKEVVVNGTGGSPSKDSVAVGVATPAAATTATSKTPAAVSTPVSGGVGGGLFSNLSNLAKTADMLLTPVAKPGELVETATKNQKDVVSSDEKTDDKKNTAAASTNDASDEAKKESEKDAAPKDSAVASSPAPAVTTTKSDPAPYPVAISTPKAGIPTPKYTPGGGLFSNLSNLAKTADSLLTAAVQGDEGNVDTGNPAESGWNEDDDDDDFFGDDNDDGVAETKTEEPKKNATNVSSDTVVSEEKGKIEESSASFVKVSPTSSISTPELLQQKDPNLQQKDTGKESSGQTSSPLAEVAVTAADPGSSSTIPVAANIEEDPRFQKLQETLRLREGQLIDKGRQLNDLQLMMESRDEQYKKKLQDTKDEAKKRIMRAKERCEAAEAKLQAKSAGDSDDMKKKQSIINELMEEGKALAQKQSRMERAVREATAETRGLKEEVRNEAHAKEQALNKIKGLEAQCKSLKDSLTSARKGESQAGKLEDDLLSARADAEEKASTILSLQQRLKELTAESKELQREIGDTRKSAAHEAQQEKTSMRREHNDLIGELEQKLRTTEREAAVREDALRHEVSEIRKRWQDAVRRADALNMDIQSSTAPLMRQLESMERQNRLRTTNAAEMESKLRSDLEEATIENERMYKESSDLKSKLSKFERSIKERDQDLSGAQSTLQEQARDLETLRKQEKKLLAEVETRQTEFERVERLANEGVARVRSEMSQTVTDSEERYRGQIKKLQKELVVETEKRSQLETQVSQLLESGGGLFSATQSSVAPPSLGIRREKTPKKLRKAEGQAEILAGALGFGSDSDSESETEDEAVEGTEGDPSSGSGFHSFAAIEQLSSKLKSAKIELESMRKSFEESNVIRQSLLGELGETRQAKEKLPLFEAKVKELTQQNREMELEIAGLKDDIADVRELYRTQLNVLLQEKTASAAKAISEKQKEQTSASEEQPPASEKEADDKSVESVTLPSSHGMVLL